MIDPISIKIQSLEKKREQLSNSLIQYPVEILSHIPKPGVWSPLEIVHHLYISEELSLRYLKKKINGVHNLRRTGFTSTIRLQLLKVVLNSPLKFKAPKIIANHPPSLSKEVFQDWKEERGLLVDFLENIDKRSVRLELYRHPFAGRLNILQMLDFFNSHFDHHVSQVFHRLPTNPKT